MKNQPAVGQIVLWYPGSDRGQEPLAAVVTKAAQDNLCINVFDSGSYNLRIKDGVRHIDDPRSRTDYGRDVGAWDFTLRDKVIDQIIADLSLQAAPAKGKDKEGK